jgi:hypothetical protein
LNLVVNRVNRAPPIEVVEHQLGVSTMKDVTSLELGLEGFARLWRNSELRSLERNPDRRMQFPHFCPYDFFDRIR